MDRELLNVVRRDLQKALELELFTLPPYLTSLYSIHEKTNQYSYDVIKSVAMEEMLHIILVSNILNAVGGSPTLSSGVVRKYYPSPVPHIISNDEVQIIDLLRFSEKAIDQFIAIEQPDFHPETDHNQDDPDTIGEFYEKITHNLIRLCKDHKTEKQVFSGSADLQITPNQYYYGGGGKTIEVKNLATALAAIEEISEQGEGRKYTDILTGNKAKFGQPKEPAHYYRFRQLKHGREYAHDGNLNGPPTGSRILIDYDRSHAIQPNSNEANVCNLTVAPFVQCYANLLEYLEKGLRGQKQFLLLAITEMHALGNHVSALMHIPIPDEEGVFYGAPFWYIEKVI